MVQAGLTPLQAISVATKTQRSYSGLRTTPTGHWSLGKSEFIVLERDPSQDIRNTQTIRAVWKNGARVSDGPLESAQPPTL